VAKHKLTIEELKSFHKRMFGFDREFQLGSILAGHLENMYFNMVENRENEKNHKFHCPKCKAKLEVSLN
jgi:hypothetical protein